MMGFFDVFQEVWAVRALFASSLVGVMCGALGAFIVLRNMSMIGDALSHAILPGVVAAFILFKGYTSLGFFAGAVVAGLITAFAITWIQQQIRTKSDAAIGIVFTAMFSIGVIGISWISRNQGVHLDLKDFLFGNVLTVSDHDLYLTATVTVFVLLSIAVFYRYLFISTFQPVIAETMGISANAIHYFLMLLLSFAVVASLQTVGVILVVAMLITPASTALLLSDRLRVVIVLSAFFGLMAAVIGLFAAIFLDTAPGPAMAVAATLLYFLAALFASRKGILARGLAARQQRGKVEREDLLKLAFKLHSSESLTRGSLINKATVSSGRAVRHIRQLIDAKLLTETHGRLALSTWGLQQASALIRAHRLWETYLVDQVGLTSEQIHDDAERYEHLLSEDVLDEVDRELGFPVLDPHGSPIPGKGARVPYPLARLAIRQQALIAQDQPASTATRKLWELGIRPGESFTILESADTIKLEFADRTLEVNKDIAREINVLPDHSSSGDPI